MDDCGVRYGTEKTFSNWVKVTEELDSVCETCDSSECDGGKQCQETFCAKHVNLEDHPKFSKILSGALQRYKNYTDRSKCDEDYDSTVGISSGCNNAGTCSTRLNGRLFFDKYACSEIKKGVSLNEDLTSHCHYLKYCPCDCVCHVACKFTVYSSPTGSSKELSSAAVVGGAVGGVIFFIILAVLLAVFLYRRKHLRKGKNVEKEEDEFNRTKSFSNTAYDYAKPNTEPATTTSQTSDPEEHQYHLPRLNDKTSNYDQIDTPSNIADPVSSPTQTSGHLDNYEFAKPFPLDNDKTHSKYDHATVQNGGNFMLIETEKEEKGFNNNYNTMRERSNEMNEEQDEYHHLRDISGHGDNDDYDRLKVARKIRNDSVDDEYDHCRPQQPKEAH